MKARSHSGSSETGFRAAARVGRAAAREKSPSRSGVDRRVLGVRSARAAAPPSSSPAPRGAPRPPRRDRRRPRRDARHGARAEPAVGGRQAVAQGPGRPATQPAQSSATSAFAGTNQVQSINEWTPKIRTIEAIVIIPMRSGSNGRPRSRRRTPVTRNAATAQPTVATSESAEADQAEVGERLHRVAVGVPDGELVGAVARSRDDEGARAGADGRRRLEYVEGLAPVASAH